MKPATKSAASGSRMGSPALAPTIVVAVLAVVVRPFAGTASRRIGLVCRHTYPHADELRLLALKQRFAGEPKVTTRELLLPTDETGTVTEPLTGRYVLPGVWASSMVQPG